MEAVVHCHAHHTEAEAAIKALQKSGLGMNNLSVLGKQ